MTLAASVLSGCWLDSPEPPVSVATSDAVSAVKATTVTAVVNNAFTFSSGVSAFGTSSSTSVTFTSASAFSIASGGNTATGTTTYGSCIFTVATSTFPASSPLAAGKVVTVEPCQITSKVSGQQPSATATSTPTLLVLGTANSATVSLPTIIEPSGNVIINGTSVGTVTLAPTTGATGGGG